MQPAGGALRGAAQEGLGDLQSLLPMLLLRGNQPAHLEHVGMFLLRWTDLGQFGLGLRQVAQFHPAYGGKEIVRVGWLKFLHRASVQ